VTRGPSRRGEAAALLALALLLIVLDTTPITNNDLFLHLKTGDLVLTTHAVPRVDDYSALAKGRPYIAHEWLSAVIFRLVQRALGFDGLIGLKVMMAIAVAALLYAAALEFGAPPEAAIPSLAFVMILAASRIMERPHLFTYLLTAAFLLLLARRRRGAGAPLWPFVPLQIVWANLHGGFVLGPVLLALAALAVLLDGTFGFAAAPPRSLTGRADASPPAAHHREAARLGGMAALLVAVSLVNPYGARLLRFPFELTGSSFMGEIYEWVPPLLTLDLKTGVFAVSPFASTYMARYYVAWMLLGLATFALAVVSWRRERHALPGGIFPLLVFLVFLVLSLRMNRNVVDFALATAPGVAATAAAIAPGLTAGLMRRRTAPGDRPAEEGRPIAPLPWIAGTLAVLTVWFAVFGYAYGPALRRRVGLGLGHNVPVAAAAYLDAIGLRGAVFNTYASGAYLVYRLYPAVRVAMDSRNDVYGDELYRLYTRALVDSDTLDDLLKRLDAGAIVLEWPNQGMMTAAAVVHRLKGWTPVYFDDLTVIYLREGGPWARAVSRDGYALLDPALYRGGATIRPDNAARALQESERALRQNRSFIARVMRIDALAGSGRGGEALEEDRRILAEDPPLFHIYTHLGWIRLGLGDSAGAAERFRRALRYQPDSQVARQGLARAQDVSSR